MRYLVLTLFLILGFSAFSQDLIVTKNGDQISCKILSIDTLRIIYRLRYESSRHEIARTEVENYYLSKATSTELEWLGRPLKEVVDLGFYGGRAVPIGNFASQDASSVLSGMALKGYLFEAELVFKPIEHLGLGISYLSQKHGMNYQEIANYYNQYFKVNTFTADGGSWMINGLFFSLQGDFELGKESPLSIYGSIAFGAPKYTIPTQNLYNNSLGYKATFSPSSTHTASFKGGLGARYKVSKFVAVHACVSYLSAHPYFFDIYWSDNRGQHEYTNYDQEIRTINAQAGVSFILYRK